MSKYFLTDAPAALPGSCRSCGSATKLPFVDMRYSEDFHGAVYYCTECIGEVASIMGFATPTTVQILEAEIELLKHKNKTLKTANIELEYINEALERAGYVKLPTDTSTGNHDLFDSAISNVLPVQASSVSVSGHNPTVEGTAAATVQSSNGKDVAGLRASRAKSSDNSELPAV